MLPKEKEMRDMIVCMLEKTQRLRSLEWARGGKTCPQDVDEALLPAKPGPVEVKTEEPEPVDMQICYLQGSVMAETGVQLQDQMEVLRCSKCKSAIDRCSKCKSVQVQMQSSVHLQCFNEPYLGKSIWG